MGAKGMAERQKRYRKNGKVKLGKVEIPGLRQRPDRRYYAAAHPNKTFGKDLAQAVYRFRHPSRQSGSPCRSADRPRPQ